ncbi:MAG: hypothetical protein ACXACX_20785 [Candidatus Hodarchaeales archaeon]|jgi:hypothetical protein
MTTSFELPLEIENLQGEKWKKFCLPCHETHGDCCKDLELTLFPDEVNNFKEKDPKNVSKYTLKVKDQEGKEKIVIFWGYNAKECGFLQKNGLCELQVLGKLKPVDCLMYPINYKNQKIFLDTSCPAQSLGDKKKAKSVLLEKLKKFPDYYHVSYDIMPEDKEIDSL